MCDPLQTTTLFILSLKVTLYIVYNYRLDHSFEYSLKVSILCFSRKFVYSMQLHL